jgi:imidazolonepropionase-like amidohydrolase
MTKIATAALAVGFALASYPSMNQAATLIHAGRVIDGVSGESLRDRTIVVDKGRITAIEQGFRKPASGDTLVDLRKSTVMPGLMDMHVHLTSEHSKNSELDRFKKDAPDVAIDGVTYAERTLMAGFTTVRDLGDSFRASVALRNAINAGKVPGPRIFAAGKSIATTGGHADPTNGWASYLNGEDVGRPCVSATKKAPTSSRSRRRGECFRSPRTDSIRNSPKRRSVRSSRLRETMVSRWRPMRTAPKA